MAARMMLLSRRRPRHPASTGKEGRGEAKKAQGGKKRAASGRKRRKAEKVMHFGFGITRHTNGIIVQETGGGINQGKGSGAQATRRPRWNEGSSGGSRSQGWPEQEQW